MKVHSIAVLTLSASLILSGCATDPYIGQQKVANTTTGSLIGSIVGAGVGVLASSKHDPGKGALIGAASGALLGGEVGAYMDVQESKPRDKLRNTGVSVTRAGDNIILNMPNNVTFDTNSSTLKPLGTETLTSVALILKEYAKTAINIVGHIDSTGSNAINQKLSLERANSVANLLIQQGTSAARMSVYGAGASQSIASNKTDSGRA